MYAGLPPFSSPSPARKKERKQRPSPPFPLTSRLQKGSRCSLFLSPVKGASSFLTLPYEKKAGLPLFFLGGGKWEKGRQLEPFCLRIGSRKEVGVCFSLFPRNWIGPILSSGLAKVEGLISLFFFFKCRKAAALLVIAKRKEFPFFFFCERGDPLQFLKQKFV